MVKTYESRIPPSPNLDKVTVSFDKLNNTDSFLHIHRVDIVHTFIKGLMCTPITLENIRYTVKPK